MSRGEEACALRAQREYAGSGTAVAWCSSGGKNRKTRTGDAAPRTNPTGPLGYTPCSFSQARRAMIEATPLQRLGTPDEIAELALFLVSERSSFTTGQTVVASGGRVTLP